MRLAACEKVPPMIRSTSEARRSSSQSRHQPSSASSDRQQRKRLHGAGSSSSPASLDVMRLSKRFHPQSSHSERSPDYAHRQVKKKGREGDYLHEITLLEFTPEKSPHLHEGGLGEDEEGGEVEVAFFDEGQECSASGTPIMNKKSPSSLIAPSRRRQNSKRRERAQLNTPQSREDRGEDEEASPYFTFQEELTLKSATSAATPPNVPMNYSLTSSSPTKLNLAGERRKLFPLSSRLTQATPLTTDVSPNQLIEICKSLIASDVFSASCAETLQLLLASKYDWIIPQVCIILQVALMRMRYTSIYTSAL